MFTARVVIGRSAAQRVSVEVTAAEIDAAARVLRDRPDYLAHSFDGGIRRGKGWQAVPIVVPRAMLIGIADALSGAVDVDDAGHRFYHWESPSSPRPCSDCRETRDADAARAEGAREVLLRKWTGVLGVPAETIEGLLAEFGRLPRGSR